jgi:hypothetical protein
MKKLIGFVCLLVLVAACQPVANENRSMNANTTEKASAPPSEAEMIAKEKAAWDAFKRKDADAFKKMLAPEYTEITGSGVKDSTTTVTGMNDVNLTDVTFADWKMTTIGKNLVLLTYTTKQKGTYKGQAFPEGPYRHGSAWANRNGEWQAVYFQETMASNEPMPPPAAKPMASAATPSGSPAELTSDVIANEKQVWEYFRTHNYDAFANLLAPEFMETEDTAVYDKAGSIKGVQEMDAAQFDLADWKAVKIDDDASLVTYTVTMKGPKPHKSYHATIWGKRDGKWLGFYHQGTPSDTGGPMASPSAEMKMSP